MASSLKYRQVTAAEQVAARMGSLSQDEHTAGIKAARERAEAKRADRRERAAAAAARLRNA